MAGGTLVVSRAANLFSYFKKRFEELGFARVTVTGADKDGLVMLINEMKPRLVIIGAGFYQSATPYMACDLLRRCKGVNIAVISIARYPADLALSFIVNGVKSYITVYDGIEQFYQGLGSVRAGESFISPSVRKRMEIRNELPPAASEVTGRELEVLRFVRNGFTGPEIAGELAVSLRTVNFHKGEMYKSFSVRNENELIRVADYLKLVKEDELNFYGRNYELRPKPRKGKIKQEKRRGKVMALRTGNGE
jgi:DNA-binding NarL/FixJ family response regulator